MLQEYGDRRRLRCIDCGIDTTITNNTYMLRDDIWAQINPRIDGMLCIACAERRLGHPFTPDDLTDVPLNRTGSPHIRSILARRSTC